MMGRPQRPQPRPLQLHAASSRAASSQTAAGIICVAVMLADVMVGLGLSVAWGQPPRPTGLPQRMPAVIAPELVAKLTAPYQVAATSKPLRELLDQVARAGDFNLWIDRHVDPDRPISLSGGAKTVFAVMAEAAQAAGATVLAVDNLVLVGENERLVELSGVLLAAEQERDRVSTSGEKKETQPKNFSWPVATTPTAALRIVDPGATWELPHDHWPAVAWRDLSPTVAILLVTAQFDQMPAAYSLATGSNDGMGNPAGAKLLGQTRANRRGSGALEGGNEPAASDRPPVPLAAPARFTRTYPTGPHLDAVRRAVLSADRRATLSPVSAASRPTAASIELAGSPAAHAAAIVAMLAHAAPRSPTAADIDSVRFTLNLRSAPAQDVLTQLAAAAGRRLQIDERLMSPIRRGITLEAKDQSLRQLVQAVADQAGVDAQWLVDTLVIRPQP